MWIGASRNNSETPLALKWHKTVKALGVHFSYNNKESVQKNFYHKLRGIKSPIRLWSWRGLSLFGKVTIIKSFLLPKVLYISSILPSPLEFIKTFQTIIYNFLGTAVINDFEFGGIKVTGLTMSIMSLHISWIRIFLKCIWLIFFICSIKSPQCADKCSKKIFSRAILAFILDNQLDIAKTVNGILPKFHLSELWIIGKIVFTLSYVKYKQFDFSLLVNGKSIERKAHFPQYYKNCWESCFNSNLKWRGCFYLEFISFFAI